jgi:hypothetical protein
LAAGTEVKETLYKKKAKRIIALPSFFMQPVRVGNGLRYAAHARGAIFFFSESDIADFVCSDILFAEKLSECHPAHTA